MKTNRIKLILKIIIHLMDDNINENILNNNSEKRKY